MASHSSIVGGSTAGRVLACPGSVQAILTLPPSADVPSEYAEEGTFAHHCMDMLMHHRMAQPDISPWQDAQRLLGMFIYDRVVEQSHIDEMIIPALDQLETLELAYNTGTRFRVLAVEKNVRFPGIPGAFGTMDLTMTDDSTVLHVDWKFGAGVPVKAVYKDPAGDLVNPQLLFYLTASKHSARHFYRGGPDMVVAIIQPRTDEPLTHTKVEPKELKWFAQDLENAIVKSMAHDAPRARGEHCRWAACKVNCPLWTGPMLEFLADADKGKQLEVATSQNVTPYGEFLARAKLLSDLAAQYKKSIDEQMHSYLEAGGLIPGWRLKAKTKQRQWVDEVTVEHALEDIGFDTKDIYQRKLVTFAHADATAKRLGVKIPAELRVAPDTNETTVCQTDDPAPVVEKALASEQFRAALAQITAKVSGR